MAERRVARINITPFNGFSYLYVGTYTSSPLTLHYTGPVKKGAASFML